MNATPRHSVIIPAYNAPATISTAVESVLAQTVTDLELIVVDDGSADSTPDLVERLASTDRRLRLIRQPNAGTAAARNRGLADARGSLVSLLDNDDAWLPTHLERAEAKLGARADAGIAYADAWILEDSTGRVNRRTSLSFYGDRAAPDAGVDELLAALLVKNFIIASSTTITREALNRVGEFDPGLRGTDDWDMWLRVATAGLTALQSGSDPSVVLRKSADSQSSDLAMMVRGNTEVLRRAVARLPAGSDAAALAHARLAADERWLRRLEAPTRLEAAAAAVRRALLPLRRAALERRAWIEPPAAVGAVIGGRPGRAADRDPI